MRIVRTQLKVKSLSAQLLILSDFLLVVQGSPVLQLKEKRISVLAVVLGFISCAFHIFPPFHLQTRHA